MTSLWHDIRYGLRVLRKSSGFTAVAVLTMALGIGANTAIFTVVYGVLLRPLPFPEPDRILMLAESYKQLMDEKSVTATELNRLWRYSEPFEYMAGYTQVGYNLAFGNAAEHLRGMPVNAHYFRVLGIRPMLGRDFVDEEDRGDGQRVAIVSYAVWMRHLGGDPGRLGQTVLLNGEPFTVIGVLPQDFNPIGSAGATDPGAADVWTPLALVAKTAGSGENIDVLARLKPGVTRAQLEARMQIVTEDFRREFPNDVGAELQLSFLPYQRMIGLGERPYLFVLLGAIGFVLLIACANVANLLPTLFRPARARDGGAHRHRRIARSDLPATADRKPFDCLCWRSAGLIRCLFRIRFPADNCTHRFATRRKYSSGWHRSRVYISRLPPDRRRFRVVASPEDGLG